MQIFIPALLIASLSVLTVYSADLKLEKRADYTNPSDANRNRVYGTEWEREYFNSDNNTNYEESYLEFRAKEKLKKEKLRKREIYHPYQIKECDLGECDQYAGDEDEECDEFSGEYCNREESLFEQDIQDTTWAGKREDSFYDELTR